MKWLFLLLAATPLCANCPIGFGTQSRGMGGVAIAYPQESFVSFSNPAGIVALHSRFDLGFDYCHNVVPEAGLIFRRCPLAMGLAYSHHTLVPAIAIQATEDHSFGAALNLYHHSSNGGLSARFGWRSCFFDRLMVGVTASTPTCSDHSMDNPWNIAAGIAILPTPYMVLSSDLGFNFDHDSNFYAKVGIAYQAPCCITVRTGYAYIDQHFLTVGASLYWINLAYIHAFTRNNSLDYPQQNQVSVSISHHF